MNEETWFSGLSKSVLVLNSLGRGVSSSSFRHNFFALPLRHSRGRISERIPRDPRKSCFILRRTSVIPQVSRPLPYIIHRPICYFSGNTARHASHVTVYPVTDAAALEPFESVLRLTIFCYRRRGKLYSRASNGSRAPSPSSFIDRFTAVWNSTENNAERRTFVFLPLDRNISPSFPRYLLNDCAVCYVVRCNKFRKNVFFRIVEILNTLDSPDVPIISDVPRRLYFQCLIYLILRKWIESTHRGSLRMENSFDIQLPTASNLANSTRDIFNSLKTCCRVLRNSFSTVELWKFRTHCRWINPLAPE